MRGGRVRLCPVRWGSRSRGQTSPRIPAVVCRCFSPGVCRDSFSAMSDQVTLQEVAGAFRCRLRRNPHSLFHRAPRVSSLCAPKQVRARCFWYTLSAFLCTRSANASPWLFATLWLLKQSLFFFGHNLSQINNYRGCLLAHYEPLSTPMRLMCFCSGPVHPQTSCTSRADCVHMICSQCAADGGVR